jgi:S1-C subfamily serine protease
MVLSLAAGGPAQMAGVLPGDILLEIDGQPLARTRAIAASLGPERIGQTIELQVLRGGAVAAVAVIVGARPD